MKTVLISIKGRWWKKILSGEKGIEIRKTAPKDIEYPFKVVCYQSGKGIVGHFICGCITKTNFYSYLAERSCLTEEELSKYANGNTGRRDGNLCGWVVNENSVVEYDTVFSIEKAGLKRPPQSWCYIPHFTANEVAWSFDGERYSCTHNNTAEALAEALADIRTYEKGKRPEKVYIGQCEFYKPSLMGTSYDVIEAVQCAVYDEGGEYAEDYLEDVTKEDREELEAALEVVFQEWITKHNYHPNFYTVPSYEVYRYDEDADELVREDIYYSRKAKAEFAGK